MPQISFTVFVEFTVSETFSRLRRVRQAVENQEYDPRWDFWRALREEIVRLHQGGQPMTQLNPLLARITDPKKHDPYAAAIAGYQRFARRLNPVFFEPPRHDWVHGDLTVRVNPELGLTYRGEDHVLKLYFNGEPLSQRRANLSLALMEEALRPHAGPGVRFGIMDVQRGRLIEPTREIEDVDVLIRGEASAFLEMWNGLVR